MNIALIGYGNMGQEVENVLKNTKHKIISISYADGKTLDISGIKKADVAIDFTAAPVVVKNIDTISKFGVPMVIGTAVFLDKYPLDTAARLCGIMNSVITAAMAGAPILGAWLSYQFHWRANFVVIAILALLSYLGTLFFIEESLSQINRKKFNLLGIMKD